MTVSAANLKQQERVRNHRELAKHPKPDLVHIAQSIGILGSSLMNKDELIAVILDKQEEQVGSGRLNLANTVTSIYNKTVQQFAISDNWFNKFQKLSVAGIEPQLRFAHVVYEGPGGFEPMIVLTVEYEPWTDQQPALPAEIGYTIVTKTDSGKLVRPGAPYRQDFLVTGKDGRLFEVWVHHGS